MGGEKTTKRTTAQKATKAGAKKYIRDDKCSVDIGAKNRTGEEVPMKKAPVNSSTFQKGGGGGSKILVKSLSEGPKDARARACSQWFDDAFRLKLQGIRKEFVEHVKKYVPSGTGDACTENATMNRYDDVICLDRTRVKLKASLTPDGIDYIHANYVTVHPDLVYICAQGPLEHTVHHFWIMIMQEETKVVLQLCQLNEDGSEKCNEYYPPPGDGTDWKTYGGIQVRVTDRNTNVPGMKKVTKSKMQVRMVDTEKTHEITHIFFHGWPDHDVAESVGTVAQIRNLVHRSYEKKPIVAHCSAGIGRTGSFAMIELVCHRLLVKHEGDFKMYNVAQELRDQRMHALQNDQQYVFVYRCVIEILILEGALLKSPEVTKFIGSYEALIERKRKERQKKKKNE